MANSIEIRETSDLRSTRLWYWVGTTGRSIEGLAGAHFDITLSMKRQLHSLEGPTTRRTNLGFSGIGTGFYRFFFVFYYKRTEHLSLEAMDWPLTGFHTTPQRTSSASPIEPPLDENRGLYRTLRLLSSMCGSLGKDFYGSTWKNLNRHILF